MDGQSHEKDAPLKDTGSFTVGHIADEDITGKRETVVGCAVRTWR